MRLIDVDEFLSKIDPDEYYHTNEIRAMVADTLAAGNDPLTLEELREMDGEPVWIETTDIKKANRWAFVDVGSEVVRFFETRCGVKCPVMGNLFRTYGKTWLAYRRKPEEETI